MRETENEEKEKWKFWKEHELALTFCGKSMHVLSIYPSAMVPVREDTCLFLSLFFFISDMSFGIFGLSFFFFVCFLVSCGHVDYVFRIYICIFKFEGVCVFECVCGVLHYKAPVNEQHHYHRCSLKEQVRRRRHSQFTGATPLRYEKWQCRKDGSASRGVSWIHTPGSAHGRNATPLVKPTGSFWKTLTSQSQRESPRVMCKFGLVHCWLLLARCR